MQEPKLLCLHCQYTFHNLILGETSAYSFNVLSVTYVPSAALFYTKLMSWSNRPLMYQWFLQIKDFGSVWLDLCSKFCLLLFRTLVGWYPAWTEGLGLDKVSFSFREFSVNCFELRKDSLKSVLLQALWENKSHQCYSNL